MVNNQAIYSKLLIAMVHNDSNHLAVLAHCQQIPNAFNQQLRGNEIHIWCGVDQLPVHILCRSVVTGWLTKEVEIARLGTRRTKKTEHKENKCLAWWLHLSPK
jgi:hypothetical protein